MSYACTQCGLCCQNIENIEQLSHLNRGDGTCIHFQEKDGCTIYESRPLACQVDAGYEVFASNLMSQKEYYTKNAVVCNKLQELAGLPTIFRVIIE